MSRSYKKNPIVYYESRDNKRYLNCQLRRKKLEKIPKGKAYKKQIPHWNGFPHRWTKGEAIQEYKSGNYPWLLRNFPTLESYLKYWAKCAYRK